MFIEKKLKTVPPRLFTANGSAYGLVQVTDSRGFYVKQKVILKANDISEPLLLEIKRFDGLNSFYVGSPKENIKHRQDISMYLTAQGATIEAAEQDRPGVSRDDADRAVYVEEPVVAKRVIAVDENGNYYNNENPMPVNASVSIGDVSVDIDFDRNNPEDPNNSNTGAYLRDKDGNLITSTADGGKRRLDVDIGGAVVTVDVDGFDPTDPDSVLVVGSEDGTATGIKHAFVNNLRQMILSSHDRVRNATYLDPTSKKNRRIEKFEFTSATFPGVTLVRTFNYSLIGNEYVFINDNWTLI